MIRVPQHLKGKKVLGLEKKYQEPIEEIIRRMYVDENMQIPDITKELGLTVRTFYKYKNLAHVFSRRIEL